MLIAQIGFEANNINLALDQLRTERRRQAREKLLVQAQQAALRALEQLRREPLITNTAAYVNETLKRHELNPWAVSEELRVDQATIRWFVEAECDLLRAQGLRGQVVDGIERDMLTILANPLTELPRVTREKVPSTRKPGRTGLDVPSSGDRAQRHASPHCRSAWRPRVGVR